MCELTQSSVFWRLFGKNILLIDAECLAPGAAHDVSVRLVVKKDALTAYGIASDAGGLSLDCGLLRLFEPNEVADHGPAAQGSTGCKFQGFARADDDSRHSPRLERVTDSDDAPVAVEKDDVDREAHEEHVHQHKRFEAAAHEKHSVAGFETVASKQAFALAGNTARIFEPRAQNRIARLVDRSQKHFAHRQPA